VRQLWGAAALLALELAGACGDAGTGPVVPPVALLPFRVPPHVAMSAVVASDSLGVAEVWLVLTNPSAATDTILYFVCAAAGLLYPEGSRHSTWQSSPPPSPAACGADVVFRLVLPPYATRAMLAGRLAGSGLIPQPPPGRYVAAAVFNDGTAVRLIRAGRVVCTAAGCAA